MVTIRQGMEKLGRMVSGKEKSKGRKYLLVALSVLLSLNILLSVMPGAVFADSSTVGSMSELVLAVANAPKYENTIIKLSGSFEISDTIVIEDKLITLEPQGANCVLSRFNGFEDSLFEVRDDYGRLFINSGVTVDGCNYAAKEALITVTDGGALYINGATLMRGNNTSGSSNGGAVNVCDRASVAIEGGTLSGNSAYNKGGAIALSDGSFLTMIDGEMYSNAAYIGAAICAEDSEVHIQNGEITANVAGYKGGAGYFSGCDYILIGKDTGEVVITDNTAPIGAGLYYCNKPLPTNDNPNVVTDYTITGNVKIDNNTIDSTNNNIDSTDSMALPVTATDTECNLFMETAYDVPSFVKLNGSSKIGLYPMGNGTAVPSDASVPGAPATAPIFYDHDSAYLLSKTTYSDTNKIFTVTTDPTAQPVLDTYTGGTVDVDLGNDFIAGGKAYCGFPMHIIAQPQKTHTLVSDSLNVSSTSGVLTEGTAQNGMWHTFDAANVKYTVNAQFTDAAAPVASVNGVTYATLAEAFAACEGKRESVITLLRNNYLLPQTIYIYAGDDITLESEEGKTYAVGRLMSSLTGTMFYVNDGAVLTLDGVKLDGDRRIDSTNSLVVVDGGKLSLVNGSAISNSLGATYGGAVSLYDGTLELGSGCYLSGNEADNGGAVYMSGNSRLIGDGNHDTQDIYSNEYSVAGGGVCMDGGVIEGCDIALNKPVTGATGTMGGGVYILDGSVIDSKVGDWAKSGASNQADTGAGIYAVNAYLEDVTVKQNVAAVKAGGVYYTDSLAIAGAVSATDNKAGTAVSNINYNGTPIKISGDLDGGSKVNLYIDTATPAAADAVLAICDNGLSAVNNASFVDIDNSTVLPVAEENKIVTANAADCITVVLQAAQNGGAFECEPALGGEINIKQDGHFRIAVSNHPALTPVFKVLDKSGNETDAISILEQEIEENEEVKTTAFIIDPDLSAVKGDTYTVVIDVVDNFSETTVSGKAPLTDREIVWANNVSTTSGIDSAITYTAAQMSSYADSLSAEFVDWKHADETVEEQMSDAKESEFDYFDGYVVLRPVSSTVNTGDDAMLGQNVKKVLIGVDVSSFASDGDTVDFVSYSGVEKYLAGGAYAGGATLHKDLMVKNGRVTFEAEVGKGKTADTIYIAMVHHKDPVASIGNTNYNSLEEAFDAAKSGDTIKLLCDTSLHSALVVKSGEKIVISSENGAVITRGDNYDGGLFHIEAGDKAGELELVNITLDGAADIVSASPLSNNGVDAKGAVIANYGKLTMDGGAIINGCHYSDTDQGSVLGGALYNVGQAVLDGTDIENCYANYGGAIYNAGTIALADCSISGNSAKENGGAIYSVGDVALADAAITGNTCSGSGAGGVYVSGDLSIADYVCITSNTSAGKNSNLYNDGSEPITISDALDSSSMIGVSKPSEANAVIAVGDGSKVKDASKYVSCFFPDSGSKSIIAKDKKVVIGTKNDDYSTISIASGDNGTISPSGDVRVSEGGDLVITVTPDAKYAVADLLVDGKSVLADAQTDSTSGIVTYELKDIDDDAKVEASFKLYPGSVIVPTATTGGTITPSTTVRVNSEDSTEFTIKPNVGTTYEDYYLASLKLDGKDVLDQAVENEDGSFTYTVSGVTADSTSLSASFQPVYSNKTLTDPASGVEVTGVIHYKAYLTVENLSENYPSLYSQMVGALTNTSTFKQYITQAYEIKLNFENEIEMADVAKFYRSAGLNIQFNLGSSYKGKTVRVFHGTGSSIDTTTYVFSSVPESGIITVSADSLSPYAIVVQEPIPSGSSNNGTGTGSGTGTGTGTGTGSSTTVDDGKGPKSGDDGPKAVPPVVIVLLVLSAATVVFVFCRFYLPRFTKAYRGSYRAR